MDPHAREFDKVLRSLTARVERWRVFADFCEMAAISLTNAVSQDAAREERYLQLVKTYTREEVERLASLLGIVTLALDVPEPPDFLGEAFTRLELSSHWHGQFFTPMNVARMMASLTTQDAPEIIREKGYVRALEPACGSGAMVIALALALRDAGIDYQRALHVTAVDVDRTAAHMATIQLSLLHIPALVCIGDSLSLEMREVYATPAHHLGLWSARLRQDAAPAPRHLQPEEGARSALEHAAGSPAHGQLKLF